MVIGLASGPSISNLFLDFFEKRRKIMYVLFVPAMAAVLVIGFIQLRDQFASLS